MTGVLLTASMLMVSTPAWADGEGFIWSWSILNLGGGTVTGIGSAVSAGVSDEPSLGWIIPGFIFGGLNVATALVFTGVSIDLEPGHEHKELLLGLGIACYVVAALDFVAASVAVSKRKSRRRYYRPPQPYPQRYPVQPPPPSGTYPSAPAPEQPPPPSVSLSPILLPGSRGSVGYGLGLQVAGW
jgi:hypothetical protein